LIYVFSAKAAILLLIYNLSFVYRSVISYDIELIEFNGVLPLCNITNKSNVCEHETIQFKHPSFDNWVDLIFSYN